MSGGLMSGGLMSGGLMSGGLMSGWLNFHSPLVFIDMYRVDLNPKEYFDL